MSSCQEVQPRAGLFVDGELGAEERAVVARHLDECQACRGLVRDLERLRATARGLGPINPPDHVWLEVAGQIRLDAPPVQRDARRPARGALRSWLGLAAGLLLATLSAYFLTRGTPPVEPAASRAPGGSVQAIADDLLMATQLYQKAITELDTLAKSNNSALDPAIAALLQQNLAATDQAIAESQKALAGSPDSVPARESLIDALRRKVDVLQATVMLMNDMARGDQAAAAESAAAVGKKG
jgi:hypothetical protein